MIILDGSMIIKFIKIELIVISFLDVTALLAHFVFLLLLVVMWMLLTWVSQSLFVMAVDGAADGWCS